MTADKKLSTAAEDKIRWIARKCAKGNLSIKEAIHLFDVLYMSDALARHEGNATDAAASIGLNRSSFYAHMRRSRQKTDWSEDDA